MLSVFVGFFFLKRYRKFCDNPYGVQGKLFLFTSLLFLNRAVFIYYTLMYQQNCT